MLAPFPHSTVQPIAPRARMKLPHRASLLKGYSIPDTRCSASSKPTTEFAQPRLSRVKRRRGNKFGCIYSYVAGHYPGIPMTGHIGTNTPNLYPLAGDDRRLTLLKRGCANSSGFGARPRCSLGALVCRTRKTKRSFMLKRLLSEQSQVRGPQTLYETKPHMKEHCCCTWQGHPWLAVSTVVAAENRPKDDVSCWVCFVSVDIMGEFVWTQSNEGPRSCCFMLGLWFHVGFRADLVIFFMLFRVGFMSGMIGALKFIALQTAKHRKFLCGLGHGVD